ncbi:MAG: cupin domain-containing protein [Actinomycetota bacterium]|nr:cupin domain-containing protein [Actinomycetota bacterium]
MVTAKPYVFQRGEGRPIDLGSFKMTVKADREATGDAFTLLEADEPPGFGPPLHIHHEAAEAFYVIDGEYVIFLESEEILCPAGAFIYIPAGVEHGFRVGRCRVQAELLHPCGDDRLLRRDGSRRGWAERREARRAGEKFSVEVTGPVPDTYL